MSSRLLLRISLVLGIGLAVGAGLLAVLLPSAIMADRATDIIARSVSVIGAIALIVVLLVQYHDVTRG